LKRAPDTAKNNSGGKKRVLQTSGEIFLDGSAIELVASGLVDDQLKLLFWDGTKAIIAPEAEREQLIYKPPDLHASISQAIRLPRGETAFGKSGALFAEIRNLFENYIGLSEREAALLTLWVITSWFPDCVPNPPQLSISGPDTRLGIKLLLLLHCLCRHALLITDLNRHSFCSLVPLMRPTLLVSQPGLSPKLLSLWHATAFSGVFVPGKEGSLVNVTCSKAFFRGMESAPCSWGDDALHLALPLARGQFPPLDESRRSEIADRFQPRLLRYRLKNFRRVQESAAAPPTAPDSGTGRNLAAYVEVDDDIAKSAATLLQSQEQDAVARRGCDVNRAVVEVIWTPSHERGEISVSEIQGLTNALLRARGETTEFSSEEIGWRMRDLGLYRHRSAKGMILKFSRDSRARIHQLSRDFNLKLALMNGCTDCRPPEVVVN
jgi:hypothetical protein